MNVYVVLLLVVIAGYILAGIFYGEVLVLSKLLNKKPFMFLLNYKELLAGGVLLLCMCLFIDSSYFKFRNLMDSSIYLIMAVTILVTVLIVIQKEASFHRSPLEIIRYGFQGCGMELVQRMVMQTFLWWLLVELGVAQAEYYAVIITALVWCLGILSEYLLSRTPFDKQIVLDMLASFMFSIGSGYVYQRSGFFVLTMLAHFLERVGSAILYNRKVGKVR